MQKIAPYVSDRRKRRKKIRRYAIGAIAAFAAYGIVFAAAWFFLRSPFFHVAKVVVAGDSGLPDDAVIALAESHSSTTHMGFFDAVAGWGNMFAWPDAIPSSTLALAPELSGLSVSKDYFSHTVTLTATPRDPAGVWCFVPGGPASPDLASEQCYWFDGGGVLFEKALSTEGDIVFIVNDYSQHDRGLDSTVLPPEFNANFTSIMDVLHASGLGVKEIDLNDLSLEEVDVKTAEGPLLEFSLRFPANDYLPVIENLMAQGGFSKLQYVDCRTQDRVFYK